MTQPFTVPGSGCALRPPFPESEAFIGLIRTIDGRFRRSLVRQWLTEGVPFAFRDCPLLYELVREWIAGDLGIAPHDITIIGSGRIGFSLAPPPDWGSPFGPDSDLDLAIVNPVTFGTTAEAFRQWNSDYDAGVVKPRSERERELWDENVKRVADNLPDGVIDPGKIPLWNRYPISQRIRQCADELRQKLRASKPPPVTVKASFRVYKDWDALTKRVASNLGKATKVGE